MLFKLAWRNISKTKNYFLAYTFSLASFAVIIYGVTLTRLTLQSNQFLNNPISDLINLPHILTITEWLVSITSICFSIYIANFFVKRRIKEFALYKILGLSRQGILLLFIIENTIVIFGTFLISLIFGVFISRYLQMLMYRMVNIPVATFDLVISQDVIRVVGINLIIIWAMMNVLPWHHLRNVSLAVLFTRDNNLQKLKQTKLSKLINFIKKKLAGKVTKPKELGIPWFAFFAFIVSVVILIYLLFPQTELTDLELIQNFFLIFLVSVLVVYYFFRGILLSLPILLKRNNRQFLSSIHLLIGNHLLINVRSLYKLLSFVTVVSAVIAATIPLVFGILNTSLTETATADYFSVNHLSFITKNAAAQEQLTKNLQNHLDNPSVHTYPVILLTGDFSKDDSSEILIQNNALLISLSDFKKISELVGSNNGEENHQVINLVEKEVQLGNAVAMIENDICEITPERCSSFDQLPINVHAIDKEQKLEDYERTVLTYFYQGTNAFIEDATNLFIATYPIIISDEFFINFQTKISETDQWLFNIADHQFGINDNFIAISLLYSTEMQNAAVQGVHQLETYEVLRNSSIALVYGTIQIMFFIVLIGVIIALVMTLFFRTLEIIENSIEEYIVARQLGLSDTKTKIAIAIEAAITQLLPFYLGMSGGFLVFAQFMKLDNSGIISLVLFDFLKEPATLTIFVVVIFLVNLLYGILILYMFSRIKTQELYHKKIR